MNDQQNEQGKSRLLGEVRAAMGMAERSRSPAEIGEQLQRDATSLELTAASFARDEAFFRAVAANVREAAAFLAAWDSTLAAVRQQADKDRVRAEGAAYSDCAGIARELRDVVTGSACSERANAWRGACDAIRQAILAQYPRSAT